MLICVSRLIRTDIRIGKEGSGRVIIASSVLEWGKYVREGAWLARGSERAVSLSYFFDREGGVIRILR